MGDRVRETFLEKYEAFLFILPDILIALFVLFLFILVSAPAGRLFKNRFLRRVQDQLLVAFIGTSVQWIFIGLGILSAMFILDLEAVAGSLLAGAGVTAIILGFAFKDIGENFLAGMILAFRRPFALDDIIESEGVIGKVKRLNIRDTQVKTFDGKDVYVPNAQLLKNPLYNYTKDGFMRLDFVVGVDFEDNLSTVRSVITRTVLSVNGVLKDREPQIAVWELGTSTVNIRTFFWIDTYDPVINGIEVKSVVMKKVKEELMKKNIGLPANIVELKNYKASMDIDIKKLTIDGDQIEVSRKPQNDVSH